MLLISTWLLEKHWFLPNTHCNILHFRMTIGIHWVLETYWHAELPWGLPNGLLFRNVDPIHHLTESMAMATLEPCTWE